MHKEYAATRAGRSRCAYAALSSTLLLATGAAIAAAPTISGSPPTSAAVDTPYSFKPTASDPDGDRLYFYGSNIPRWMRINRYTGQVSGTPPVARTYSNIVISVTDGRSRASLPAFTLTVTAGNQAPVISGTPPSRATEGQAYSFTPTASDANGDRLSFSVSNPPSWATFDTATGRISGTPPAGSAGQTFSGITITVSDGQSTAALGPFAIQVVAAGSVAEDMPHGIYAMDRVVDLPYVDGVAVRPRWSEMEPTEGSYDFSKIDRAVRDAAALGQQVTIASLVNFAPDWLFARSQTFVSRDETLIRPWDETMLQAMERLAQAMAAHTVDGVPLRDHPAVKQINASVGGITSIRLFELPPDYTADKLDAAVLRSLRIWADAFPAGKHLYVGLFAINDGARNPSTAEALRDLILDEFNGTERPRMYFFQELLTGLAPVKESNLGSIMLGVDERSGVMFQACGPWSDQDSGYWPCNWVEPSDSPELGFELGFGTYGALYFEIYNKDLQSTEYAPQFEYWHGRIQDALQ